jgi:hypothetical protein
MGVLNRISRLGPLLLGLGLVGLLYGCGSGAVMRAESPGATAGESATASPLPDLPTPVELSRTASAWNYAECHGADFLVDAAHNRITTKATLAGFNPDWRLNERHPLDDLAFAIYALHVPGFAGASKVSLLWFDLPPQAQTCWVGLGNQQHNRWDWFPLQDDSTVRPRSLAPYTSDAQQIYVAVVLLGEAPRSLNGLWVGEGTHLYYEVEDNDTADNATPLPPLPFNQVELTGSLGSGYSENYDGDSDDWYSFVVTEPSIVKLSFRVTSMYGGQVYFKFFQSDDAKQPQLIYYGYGSGDSHLKCSSTGQYWLELTCDTPGELYSFSLSSFEDKFSEIEDNDTPEQANLITTTEDGFLPVSGCLSIPAIDDPKDTGVYDGDRDDWFYFDIQSIPRVTINISANTPKRRFTAEVYAADGVTRIDSVDVDYNSSAEWRLELPSLGKYYLRLYCDEDADYVTYFFSIIHGADNHGWFSWKIDQGTSPDQSNFTNMAEMVGFETDGRPELCWRNSQDNALYYIHAGGASFAKWSKPQLIVTYPHDTWKILSSFVVDERPAIVCSSYDPNTHGAPRYYYIIATDKSGEEWNDPVGIKIDNVDSFDALAFTEVQGSPALIGIYGYYPLDGEYKGVLFYSRAEDASGMNWSNATILDDVWNTSACCSMQIINGKPAAAFSCYYDSIYCFVRYVQANDELGTTWAEPVNVYEYIDPERVVLFNWFASPTIYIQPEWTRYLPRGWFTQAVDADGQSWNAPYDTNLLISDTNYGCNAIFALVDSIPRAVWGAGRYLMYSYAEEYDGSKWAYAEVIGSIAVQQGYTCHCMFDLKGQLGIAYFRDGLRFALRY